MLKPIKSNKEHEEYLSQAYQLMQKELVPNSEDSDKLELLSLLIEVYEKEHHPIESRN